MKRVALILAAHGAGDDSPGNRQLTRLTRALAARTGVDAVRPTFHLGQPCFATILDKVAADVAVVIPVMTAHGYYCDYILPRELARNRNSARAEIRLTPPVGSHPAVPQLVMRELNRCVRRFALGPYETSVLVVGHGTRRAARSTTATYRLCAQLRRLGAWAGVEPGFLSDQPPIENVAAAVCTRNLLVYPFLIGGGAHALADLPARLGCRLAECRGRPPAFVRGGGHVVFARAFGQSAELIDLLEDSAHRALSHAAPDNDALHRGFTRESVVTIEPSPAVAPRNTSQPDGAVAGPAGGRTADRP